MSDKLDPDERMRRVRSIATLKPDEALICFRHGDAPFRHVKVSEDGLVEAMTRCNREFGTPGDIGGPNIPFRPLHKREKRE